MKENVMPDPDWWKKAVFYQIYPRSFMDRNDDGIGDLAGITDRLHYVADLGVDAIWISPFFQSPMKDFGYDVSDYRLIDPIFGHNEDFDFLIERAHQLDLKVIIDMVCSHTSTDHPWFVESRLSKTNRKADWYVWADPKPDGTPPNNWQSIFGGPAWTFDTRRGQYYMHNFLKEQPDLNYHNKEVQKQILSEFHYWLERGVDGFRLDVVNFYYHDGDLRDNPPRSLDNFSTGVQVDFPYPYTMQSHIYDKSRPENIEFLKKLRILMDRYPYKMTLGEIGDDDPFKLTNEYTAGSKVLHTAYNTHLMSGKLEELTSDLIEVPCREFEKEAQDAWPSWAFSNHDVVRSVTRWGKSIRDTKSFAIMLNKLLLSLRGTPFIYQGEELGLPEADISFEQIQDPWGKVLWPEWKGRDGCRTPMPWSAEGLHAGFSESLDVHTWLPIPHDHLIRAVDIQEKDENSVLNETRRFIAWRKETPVLQEGKIEFLKTGNDKILGFIRSNKKNKLRCLFNLSEALQTYEGIKLSSLEARFDDL